MASAAGMLERIFFVSNEDGETVGMAWKIVRKFERHWSPRYMLVDQSSVEANSIQAAFPGLIADEQKCDVILCTVHVMRIHAMHKRTEIGCDYINSCPVPSMARRGSWRGRVEVGEIRLDHRFSEPRLTFCCELAGAEELQRVDGCSAFRS